MAKEKFNFKNAFEKLEEINESFQTEDIDIDDALEKYKKGLELIKKCKQRLGEVENEFLEAKKEHSVE